MKKTCFAAFAGLSIASFAAATPGLNSGQFNLLDPSMYTLTAEPLSGFGSPLGTLDPSFYSAMDPNAASGNFSAFAPASGPIGFDDYSSIATDDIVLTSFRFVGGVAQDGGTMSFAFFDSTEIFVDSFGVALPAGNNIWTITLNDPITIPAGGLVQAVVGEGFTGQWFLADTAPTIGSNDPLIGGANGGALSHRFELNGVLIPTPGAAGLLGLAGLAAVRRRR